MPSRRGIFKGVKTCRSKVFQNTGATITSVIVELNGIGTFRVFIGTASVQEPTSEQITWEEIATDETVTLTNPNIALLYEIVGSNGAQLFVTDPTVSANAIPGVQIEIF